MPTVTTPQDGAIYYEEHGTGAPVFLISGLGGTLGAWAPQIAHFAARYRLILHDHRGTGRSSRNRMRYTVPLMADDVLAIMDHLEIDKAHVVGHSTGAAMTQDIALRHPDRLISAVFSGSWPEPDFVFRRAFEVRRATLRDCGVETYVKSTPLFMYPPQWLAENADTVTAAEPAAIAGFPPPEIMLARIDAICAYGPGERLRDVRAPSLVTCASDDILTPRYYSERIASLIPKAATYFFESGGHAMPQTRAAEYNAVVSSFIDAVSAGRTWQPPAR